MAYTNNHTQPFLKWAGGKGQLLDQYEAFFPAHPMQNYYEPFVGSGAVFFRLRAKGLFERYHLSDVNAELITCFLAVRDQVEELIARLTEHHDQHDHDYYYRVRALDRQPDWADAPGVERAARMIYLNKTCYNGLWRVNSKGQFNVPMGRYKNPDILNADRLRRASEALQGVEIGVRHYHPLSQTASFTSYSADSFGPEDQRRLADVFAALATKGCRVMLSNSDTEFVRELYRDFRIETVTARRAINSAGGKRGPITEVVVLSFDSES